MPPKKKPAPKTLNLSTLKRKSIKASVARNVRGGINPPDGLRKR